MKYSNVSILVFGLLFIACNRDLGLEAENSHLSEKETSAAVLDESTAYTIPDGVHQVLWVELYPLYRGDEGIKHSKSNAAHAADSSFGAFNGKLQTSGFDRKICYRIWHGLSLHCLLNERQRLIISGFSNVASIGPLPDPCAETINH